jgi:DNA-binding MarR family transcriptional regulator
MEREATQLYRNVFDLGLGEIRMIWVLGHETTITAIRLSQLMGVDKGAISRAAAKLEEKRMLKVRFDPNDARVKLIELTSLGQQAHDHLKSILIEREREVMSIFSPAEAEQFSLLLQRLRNHLEDFRTPQPAPFVPKRATRK